MTTWLPGPPVHSDHSDHPEHFYHLDHKDPDKQFAKLSGTTICKKGCQELQSTKFGENKDPQQQFAITRILSGTIV